MEQDGVSRELFLAIIPFHEVVDEVKGYKEGREIVRFNVLIRETARGGPMSKTNCCRFAFKREIKRPPRAN